jgi:hypothetical protein
VSIGGSGSATGRYREMGVGDLSLVLGHDDDSALRTLEAIAA